MKGGLFLGVGPGAAGGQPPHLARLVPAAIMALGLAGLPLTGGFLAKLAIKPVLGDGWAGSLGSASSAATALLMTHFLFRVAAMPAESPGPLKRSLLGAWLLVTVASILVPWTLYISIMAVPIADAVALPKLLQSLFPVLLGCFAGLAWQGWGGAFLRLEDDEVVLPVWAYIERMALRASDGFEQIDHMFRQWPVAVLSLFALAVTLAALMWAGT